jgi:hypothetical protein
MMTIVVVAGHRCTINPRGVSGVDGGPGERDLTPRLARAYVATLRAAGHDAYFLQEEDGDDMADDTVGDLDAVARATQALCCRVGADLMLDVHLGDEPTPGVFAIVPDAAGLRSTVVGDHARDTWESNGNDVLVGRAIVDELSAMTGLTVRRRFGVREPGLLSESRTWIGQGSGGRRPPSRLTMFARTVELRGRTVRLVVEHGSITQPDDRLVIYRDDFVEHAAAGLVRALGRRLGFKNSCPSS